MAQPATMATLTQWLAPFGLSVRLFVQAFTPASFASFSYPKFREYAVWMGLKGFHLVSIAAVFVSIALTIETVIELEKYRAQYIAGAAISIGLLRELGPMTVSLAWCARVSAFVAEITRKHKAQFGTDNFGPSFVLTPYLAAVFASIPLGGYGLGIGFVTGALFAPLIGVSSTVDFLESARMGIQDQDLFVYFFKLVLINPTIGVFAGLAAGLNADADDSTTAANAITSTFVGGYIANLAVTSVIYLW